MMRVAGCCLNVDRLGQPGQVVAHDGDGLAPGSPELVPQRLRVDAAGEAASRFQRPTSASELARRTLTQSSSAAARATASAGRAMSRSIAVSTGSSTADRQCWGRSPGPRPPGRPSAPRKAQLDKPGLLRIALGEPIQGDVEGEQIHLLSRGDQGIEVHVPCRWSPPCFRVCLRRAFSTRMRRMASAAAAKKWPRPSQVAPGPGPPAADRPRGPGPWPGASGPASRGRAAGRPASAIRRRPAAAVALRPAGRPARSLRGCGSRHSSAGCPDAWPPPTCRRDGVLLPRIPHEVRPG